MKSSIYTANPNTPSGSSTLDGERIISLHNLIVSVSDDFVDNLVVPLGHVVVGVSDDFVDDLIIPLSHVVVSVCDDFIDNLVIPSRDEPFLRRLALGAVRKQIIYRYVTSSQQMFGERAFIPELTGMQPVIPRSPRTRMAEALICISNARV